MRGYFKPHNRRSLKRTIAPASQPVTLTEAKAYMRVDGTDDDTLITDLIEAATDFVESYLRRALITQTWRLTLDWFPRDYGRDEIDISNTITRAPIDYYDRAGQSIELAYLPIQSVTSIETYDDDNNATTYSASNYYLDDSGARITLVEGAVWPTDLRDRAAIDVTYVAGYGDSASDVPQSIRIGIRAMVQSMYENGMTCEGCFNPMYFASYRLYDQMWTL